METKDTGKVTLSQENGRYLRLVIYANGEFSEEDLTPILDYLDQFPSPQPVLIERAGHYSMSVLVQLAIMQQTRYRLSAVAYLERNHRDVIMTRVAASTYFRDVPVKSFYQREQAIEWLETFSRQTSPQPRSLSKQASYESI